MFAQTLSQLSIFHDLNESQLGLLQAMVEPCRFQKSEIIFEQGEAADNLYIVTKGDIQIRYKAFDGPIIEVARVGPGGIFGWSAALGRDAYTSGAVCLEDCEVYRISALALCELCGENPETGTLVLDRLAGAIADRLSSTHNQVVSLLQQSKEDGGCSKR